MEAVAKLRNLKGSPQKTRLVIDLIRGRNVSQALAILKFTNKRAADPIAKVLRSAIANATYSAEQQNIAIDPDDLFVKTCFVDMGPHKNRRRMRPAPQGRAFREQRHYCHITVLVSSEKPEVKEAEKPRKKGKKLLAKEAGEDKTKTTKKADKAIEVKEEKVVAAEVTETAEAKVEEPKVEEKVEAATSDEFETQETGAPEPSSETTPVDNIPLAAQTDEQKTGTKMAEDAQIDRNEELEKQ